MIPQTGTMLCDCREANGSRSLRATFVARHSGLVGVARHHCSPASMTKGRSDDLPLLRATRCRFQACGISLTGSPAFTFVLVFILLTSLPCTRDGAGRSVASRRTHENLPSPGIKAIRDASLAHPVLSRVTEVETPFPRIQLLLDVDPAMSWSRSSIRLRAP